MQSIDPHDFLSQKVQKVGHQCLSNTSQKSVGFFFQQKPKVFLTLEEMVPFRPMPNEPVEEDEIPPLYVMDLQQLLLYGIQGNRASYKPRYGWLSDSLVHSMVLTLI